ncbi:MAG: hypothetical protein ACRDGN_16435 [bacterium]
MSLGPLISTSSSNEQDAALSKDGLSLYFVSDRTGGIGGNDIWVSQRSDRDAQWGPPVNLGSPINTSSNENTVALSRDGHWLFFGSGRPGGFGASELYASYRDHVHDDFAWQAPANLGAGVNTADVELSPSYFENDEGGLPQLYFTRGRFPVPGGDIYVSELTADGSWGVAVPVAGVNSSAAERGPSVSHDGLNLYFWSNRSGAVHIFVSTRESVFDPWSAAQRVDVSLGESGEVEPFIHYHAGIETLLMVGDIVGGNNDLFMSMRTRRGGAR